MKDTFYFSHDYNSRSDEKIKLLIRKHGMLGYGCFWSIIEDLYQNANALRTDYEGIAFDLRIDVSIVKSILNDFDLFLIDGEMFGSLSVERRLNERNQKSKKAKESANSRWEQHRLNANALKEDANALRVECEGNAIKESKGKETERKVKENNSEYLDLFDKFRTKYKGTKRGNETEFEYFKKTHEDWKKILPLLETYVDVQIEQRKKAKEKNQFVPEWKNLKTYIYNRSWEETKVIEEEQPIKRERKENKW